MTFPRRFPLDLCIAYIDVIPTQHPWIRAPQTHSELELLPDSPNRSSIYFLWEDSVRRANLEVSTVCFDLEAPHDVVWRELMFEDISHFSSQCPTCDLRHGRLRVQVSRPRHRIVPV